MPLNIVALEGDQTGQELLEQALRVLDPDLLGLEIQLERFDLSLENRRVTSNGVVEEAASAMRAAGLGVKAATITPEGAGDVGSPNRILREEVGGKVILRTGRRLPGVTPVAGVHHPISIVRMAVEDAYGAREWRENGAGWETEVAYRTERVTRSTCRAVADTRSGPRSGVARGCTEARNGRSPPSTRGCSRRRWMRRRRATRTVEYQPVLIDATYAGLSPGAPTPRL